MPKWASTTPVMRLGPTAASAAHFRFCVSAYFCLVAFFCVLIPLHGPVGAGVRAGSAAAGLSMSIGFLQLPLGC